MVGIVFVALYWADAAAQCCGDCDGNGTVGIDELITAVDQALDACPEPRRLILTTKGSLFYGIALNLDRQVTRGRIAFTVIGGQVDDVVYFRANETSPRRYSIGLVREDGRLRFFVREPANVPNQLFDLTHDIFVNTSDWHHQVRIDATWGDGSMALTVDGEPSEPVPIGDVVLPAGAAIMIGRPGIENFVPWISDIVFVSD